MTQDKIEEEIIRILDEELKPELRKRIDYMFRDYDENEPGPAYHNLAGVTPGLKPSPIVFYTAVMKGHIEYSNYDETNARAWIKRVISHEIAHLFSYGENFANSKQRNNNFF